MPEQIATDLEGDIRLKMPKRLMQEPPYLRSYRRAPHDLVPGSSDPPP